MQKCLKYLLIAILPMWFGYVAVSKELIIVLASEKYAVAATFSPLILLASFVGTLNVVFGASFYLKKKTMLMFLIEFSSIPSHWNELNIDKKTGIYRSQYFRTSIDYCVTTLMIVVSRRYFRIGLNWVAFSIISRVVHHVSCRHPN